MIFDVLGTGLNIFSSLKSGSAKSKEAKYRAQLAEEGANATRLAGNVEEGNLKAQYTRRIAEQTTAYAANGIDVASPVVGRVHDATQLAGDLDAAVLHYNAAREAYGLDTEAALYRKAAKNAKTTGFLNAATSLLSGASSLSGKWGAFQQSGALGSSKSDPYARLNDKELG
jgi:hypothetical protein